MTPPHPPTHLRNPILFRGLVGGQQSVSNPRTPLYHKFNTHPGIPPDIAFVFSLHPLRPRFAFFERFFGFPIFLPSFSNRETSFFIHLLVWRVRFPSHFSPLPPTIPASFGSGRVPFVFPIGSPVFSVFWLFPSSGVPVLDVFPRWSTR